jgi:hypothetical protein
VIVIAALLIRVADFPPRYCMRDMDERPYVQSGLALWEGITPTYEYSPAGPQIWISWTYAAASSAAHFSHPGPEERSAPAVLRPFVAVNHALFDVYRDWSLLRWIEVAANIAVAVAAVAAAFALGVRRGGLAVGIFVGGLTAALPLFVQLSGEARPYIMGWSLGIIALYFSAIAFQRRRAATWSAIAMGLAIGSRVDMLLLLPLAYADLWYADDNALTARLRRLLGYTAIVAIASLLIAPWLLTNLMGNLRAIVSVRAATPTQAPTPLSHILRELVWDQGLIVALLATVAAIVLPAPGRPRPRWIAGVYVILLAASILKATGFGLRHQGGPITAVIVFAGAGMAAVAQRWPRVVWTAVALGLLLPIIQSGRDIARRRDRETNDYATLWLERHVPPGTRIYLSPTIHDPLPTVEASRAIWGEVADPDAWKTKVQSALRRFSSVSKDLPPALSEENMIVERGVCREWFILGSRTELPDARFDIRVFSYSEVFGVREVASEYRKTGGVLICDDVYAPMPTGMGQPVAQWVGSRGGGVRVYCSPDVLERLKDPQNLAAW